jgi:cytochrome c5
MALWATSNTTGAQSPQPPRLTEQLPAGAGADIVLARCTTCHSTALIVQQRLSADAWAAELDKMVRWGAVLDGVERQRVLDYVAAHFSDSSASRASDGEAAGLVAARCTVCHDRHLIDQQRLDADGWRREVDKMISWGASVTDAEREAIVEHLARR